MTVIIIGVITYAAIGMQIIRHFGLEKWQVSLGLIAASIAFYLLNIILMKYFISKRIPEFSSNEEVLPGVQNWELTAGLGVVPKWVSKIGLLSVSALITAFLPWIIALFK